MTLCHEPGEFPFTQQSVLEVESTVLPDVNVSQSEFLEKPEVLVVSVVVLGGTEGVGDPLNRVYYGAGEVVCRIHSKVESENVERTTSLYYSDNWQFTKQCRDAT